MHVNYVRFVVIHDLLQISFEIFRKTRIGNFSYDVRVYSSDFRAVAEAFGVAGSLPVEQGEIRNSALFHNI